MKEKMRSTLGQLLHFYRQQTERSVYQNTTCGGVSGFRQNERIMIEQWEAYHFKKVKQNFLSLLFSQRTWLIKLLKLPMDGLTNDWKPSPFNRQNKQGQGHRHSVNGNGWIWENHLPFHQQQLPTGNNHWPMAIPSPQNFYYRPGLSVSNYFANQVEVLSFIPFTHTIPLHPSEPWFPPHLRACVTSLGRWLPQPWWGTGQ